MSSKSMSKMANPPCPVSPAARGDMPCGRDHLRYRAPANVPTEKSHTRQLLR
jgi:hypothetical protein